MVDIVQGKMTEAEFKEALIDLESKGLIDIVFENGQVYIKTSYKRLEPYLPANFNDKK